MITRRTAIISGMAALAEYKALGQMGPHRKIFPSAPTGIAYTGIHADNGGSGVSSIAATVTGVPAGATILFAVAGATAPTSTTDSAGTTTQIGTNQTWNAGGEGASIWYVPNASSGSHTITANWGGLTNFTRLQVLVFTGANAASPIDTNHAFAIGSGIALSSGSFTTTTSNEMLVAFINTSPSTTLTAGSPPAFTIVQAAISGSTAAEYAPASTATAYTATAAASTSVQWVVLAVALKQ
jgi:hypothetical protein